MRVTQWGEYGIHCATYIGRKQKEGMPSVPAAEIAQYQGIALDYTQQILQRLRKADIIKSVRGPQGGYLLSRPAHQIFLRDILAAAEGDTFEVICETKPLGHVRCDPAGTCSLRPLWYALREHVNEFLLRYNLEQLITNSPELPKAEERPIQIGALQQ